MRHASVLAVFAAAVSTAAAAPACQLVYGLGDFRSGEAGGSGGSANGGGGGSSSSGETGGTGGVGGVPKPPKCGGGSRGAACVPAATEPFEGYFHVVKGKPADAPSSCSGGAAPRHYFQDPPPDACNPCGCGGPPAPACTVPVLRGYADSTDMCENANGTVAHGSGCQIYDAKVEFAAPDPIACAPIGGDKAGPDFATELTLCEVETTSTGCDDGEICTSNDATLCLVQKGNVGDCPTDWEARELVYAGSDDGRQCSTCSCKPNFTCPGVYQRFDGQVYCLSPTDINPGECHTGSGWVRYDDRAPQGDMSCIPSDVQESGTFVAQDPYTVCCQRPLE